jgi:hypothetical protein
MAKLRSREDNANFEWMDGWMDGWMDALVIMNSRRRGV